MKKVLQRLVLALTLLASCQFAMAQTRQITGKVTDATGGPLIGVSVVVKGTTQGGITDDNGAFSLQAANNATLVFSYVSLRIIFIIFATTLRNLNYLSVKSKLFDCKTVQISITEK